MTRRIFSLRRLKIGLVCVGVSLIVSPAKSADVDGSAVFSGLILDGCSVNVLTAGTLGVSGDHTKLSTEESGGIPATASVITNSLDSSIQVIAPDSFMTAPSGADANTVFETSYDLSGVTILTVEMGAMLSDLNVGLTTVTIDAAVTKSAGMFSAGAYSFVTTIRCVTP